MNEILKSEDFEKRAMLEVEDKYTFQQSRQISNQTGLIGYLRADMDSDGNGFFSTWNDFRKDLKTQEFKDEFDNVINSLREEGDVLHNRKSLADYCYSNPQSKMSLSENSYGVRVNTDNYAYLFRLNPNKGEYNLYCYCYKKEWLDCHIKQAEKGIRFITSHYKELFRINDGESIRIKTKAFSDRDEVCRYIDDYHLEVGNNLYHICEFAEKMELKSSKVIPLRKSLPDYSYVYVETEDCIGRIQKGETGYETTDYGQNLTEPSEKKLKAEQLNKRSGITKVQADAMMAGSMFGWDKPAADPKNYDAEGKIIKPKNKNRGDER